MLAFAVNRVWKTGSRYVSLLDKHRSPTGTTALIDQWRIVVEWVRRLVHSDHLKIRFGLLLLHRTKDCLVEGDLLV